MQSTERWLPVVGYEGLYEVSDHGRVRSLPLPKVRLTGRLMTLLVGSGGHLYVGLSGHGRPQRKVLVHPLVLTAFVGPRPEGLVGCHADDVPTNNHISNLRWDTMSANAQDSVRNGRNFESRKTHCPSGHEYTAENTYRVPSRPNQRRCRECNRVDNLARYHKRRAKGDGA